LIGLSLAGRALLDGSDLNRGLICIGYTKVYMKQRQIYTSENMHRARTSASNEELERTSVWVFREIENDVWIVSIYMSESSRCISIGKNLVVSRF
jgi:hypothetical protein